ncbi:MAG: cation:proton antiporter [Armatimonadota bacterium]|nr:cation:proton antiporter [Armatimonadota bacterium]
MNLTRTVRFLLLLAIVAIVSQANVAASPMKHTEVEQAIGPILLALIVIILTAKFGADLAVRVGQPPVLGELALGLIIGNITLFGFYGFDFIRTNQVVSMLAEIGVVLLLFEVGLESNLKEMTKVGPSSFLVAAVGVVAPFVLGFGVARTLLPQHSVYSHVFIGAVLCATSVGITARVLKDLGKLHLVESRIILGAAVIDDVMGLVVIAIVQGIIKAADGAGSLTGLGMAIIVAKAIGFLVGSVVIGQLLAPRVFRFASKLKAHDLLLGVSLAICFLFAYIADRIGLAAIVGAFAAGLILDEVHYEDFTARGERGLEDLLRPITSFLVPVFFILMGMRVRLEVFGDLPTLAFAGALTAAAIIGKQVCAFGALGKGLDRTLIGFGMIPRGEVGLIVAAIGAGMVLHGERIVDSMTFSAVVIMVMLTTFVTPPLLRWRMGRVSPKR